jgi:hypothetical protein
VKIVDSAKIFDFAIALGKDVVEKISIRFLERKNKDIFFGDVLISLEAQNTYTPLDKTLTSLLN